VGNYGLNNSGEREVAEEKGSGKAIGAGLEETSGRIVHEVKSRS
jgi:hypothetical protein